MIDKTNIKILSLQKHRSRIGIIPQDPLLLFRKSLRQNLDPFNLHTDTEIRKVLEQVQMKKSIDESFQGNLDAQVFFFF